MKALDELGIAPFPWDTHDTVAMYTDEVTGWWITDADGNDLIMDFEGNSVEEKIATARLVAAAPELYEALRYCVNFIGDEAEPLGADCETCEMIAKAKAALAKASGESEGAQ